jgi:hypothetical protein
MENPPKDPPEQDSIFNESDFSLKGYDKHIRRARTILYVIAGFQVLGIFLSFRLSGTEMLVTMIVYGIFALIFAGLAIWTKQKPFLALLIALILYVGLVVGDAIFEPSSIAKGILLKAVFIALLITGVIQGKEAEDLRKAFGKEE